ncbi:hypothetical protein AB4455_12410 [Vibrio sp. 10N.261.46.E12]|uniref:hypothetical protein n=1 Tax=unclassified Vibrio TaxID=2614977 RepID=UPI0009758DF7|nr:MULTISPECIES: hypothetical protein [unclassified Vibrio]OMO36408.1 hypothetical protein BH584_03765 [Vibrio sp. 10N.261.45.E1]PMJ22074.1 hypothetical protein BCU27_16805 [Vibrio sp. 10N.286.45.B6]PML86327.1 hypothetical protein BCT66_14620 [Vibrio sp. 10N.261.49.E11]PMM76614.1 hypothetical protein BCT48_02250 [Vibrio sp. 10N.261.46.F12]PMM86938.1 hypothetical protein BCT46_07165 [Vibrio sp. 10N.261.46.E8]
MLKHHKLITDGDLKGKYQLIMVGIPSNRLVADSIAKERDLLIGRGEDIVYFNPKGNHQIEIETLAKIKKLGRGDDIKYLNLLT